MREKKHEILLMKEVNNVHYNNIGTTLISFVGK